MNTQPRFLRRKNCIADTLTGKNADIDNVLSYANAWDAFGTAIESGDERVDDVIARAGLDDDS